MDDTADPLCKVKRQRVLPKGVMLPLDRNRGNEERR